MYFKYVPMEELCNCSHRLKNDPAVARAGSILRLEIEQSSTSGQTDRQKDMTKLIRGFRDYGNEPKTKFSFEVHDASITKERKAIR